MAPDYIVPFLDVGAINARYISKLSDDAKSVILSGWYVLGQNVLEFETKFAEYCGVKYCSGVASGLDALTISLLAWKEMGLLSPGDEVLVPSNTYIATVLAVLASGMTPKLVEPCLGSYNIDPEEVARCIGPKTKVIIAVHLYGRVAPLYELRKIADKNGLLILEDAAQAHGASLGEEKVGALGDAAAFSFYPGKNLGCLGDGGAITSNDAEFFELVTAIRNYGSHTKYINDFYGVNSRLDEMQARFLLTKLPYLDEDNHIRREIAARYTKEINNPNIITPDLLIGPDAKQHVYHLYVIRTPNRIDLKNHLKDFGVETLIHYPIPPFEQKGISNILAHCECPISKKIHKEVLSLPISPVMTAAQCDLVIEACNSWISH